mmetsp:Transcript_43105/g.31485  ORF Transcript_43105/g.31485 Transcript_43105/m.31485 type:complete len:180 (+) Transcript_43105:799-1338(+)|eukprot:CAMPEP_0202960490 /NCGR_PEP_ID=MMETSP1396-20130829/4623_1 /ASSEMBLY_ACC=CAM_ASM_000872 /TAXON_ID= /ORGANISM="Pseudokeronopsis sp., Strain Brazil" /LENGTH=179 /DNA_ID=CAMNT_0049679729 /DNA_START=795 /DNA_END=1330 /DNA_ORIENTATION=-
MDDEEQIEKLNDTFGRWPESTTTYGPVHLVIEFIYELLLGTRLISAEELDPCEIEITNFTIIYHAAIDTIKAGETYDEKEKGLFELFDTFMVFTPTTIICHDSSLFIVATITQEVAINFAYPVNILENIFFEFFRIVSGVMATIANAFYEDYFSLFYWIGDLLYRVFVIYHGDFQIRFP